MIEYYIERRDIKKALALINTIENENGYRETIVAMLNLVLLDCGMNGDSALATSIYAKIRDYRRDSQMWKYHSPSPSLPLSPASTSSSTSSFCLDIPVNTLSSRSRLLVAYLNAGKVEEAETFLLAWERGGTRIDTDTDTNTDIDSDIYTKRRSRGRDINASCGSLANKKAVANG